MKLGIKRSKDEHKVKGRQYLTLMFVTDATKDIKSIKIHKWIRFPIMIIVFIAVLASLSLYEYVVGLETTVANNIVMTQEASRLNESKDLTISDLEGELNVTKETRYEQLVELQEQAITLGKRLSELEEYRNEMQNFKDEIDTNLSTTEEEVDTDTDALDDGALLDIDSNMLVEQNDLEYETFKLQINPIGSDLKLSTSAINGADLGAVQDSVTYNSMADFDAIDFEKEIEKLNSYLDLAINEIELGEDEFVETAESLEDIIPYVEAYPSILPIQDTYITSPFGYRKNPFGGYSTEFHTGVDLKATYEPVMATGAGVVVESKYLSGYGYTIIIDHGYGIMTKYAHNSKLYAKVGDQVVRGDIISKSGNTGRSTGPHLHYEILIDGEPQNPLNFIYEENN